VGFDKGLVSAKIDVWLNGQALDPVLKWCLSDLQINLSDKSYLGITMVFIGRLYSKYTGFS